MQVDRLPIHVAAARGHTGIVDILVDKFKTSIAARTKDGNTLMHIASQFGHPETALSFLKKGVPLQMPNKVIKCRWFIYFRITYCFGSFYFIKLSVE